LGTERALTHARAHSMLSHAHIPWHIPCYRTRTFHGTFHAIARTFHAIACERTHAPIPCKRALTYASHQKQKVAGTDSPQRNRGVEESLRPKRRRHEKEDSGYDFEAPLCHPFRPAHVFTTRVCDPCLRSGSPHHSVGVVSAQLCRVKQNTQVSIPYSTESEV
jgi:hypothetical protein